MISKFALASVLAFSVVASTSNFATAGTSYDGSWDLNFVTQKGSCDAKYDFQVNVTNGIVSHPVLVKFTGRVASNGSVKASVEAGDKFAAGVGKLSGATGRGTWSGYSGQGQCSGYWTAERT